MAKEWALTKKFEPTDEQRYSVEIMAGIGIPHDLIALAIGISEPTLRLYFREQLDCGKVRTITRVAESLVRQALAGNTTAAIFYLKAKGGWRDIPPAAAPLGKKEAAAQAAHEAGKAGDWGDDLAFEDRPN